ncbi:MAG TPA: DUF2934 domain-containing protein [Beijerinckiaceae bacterium]|jgi:hypothetical protein
MTEDEEARRRRAYEIWEREGRPHGRSEDHWREAGQDGAPPAAGPHAKPELTRPASTPGAGTLPDPDNPVDSQDSTSG